MGLQIYDYHSVDNQNTVFTDADGTSARNLFQPMPPAGGVDHLLISSTAAAPRDVTFLLGVSSPNPILRLTVPAGAGMVTGIPVVDGILSLPTGLSRIVLSSFETLSARLDVALGSGETLTIVALGGDF